MLHCVAGLVVPDFLEKRNVFTFRVDEIEKNSS